MTSSLIVGAIWVILISVRASPLRSADWRNADRSSAGIAPLPSAERRAVVQIYTARALHWRGWFAVHSWMAIKVKDASNYEVIQVVGWRLWHGRSPVIVEVAEPDRRWFGREPSLIFDLRGEQAAAAIPKIKQAVSDYPYSKSYRLWPGPNSNTFISYVIRSVPELRAELPPDAIGRDFLVGGRLFGSSESGTGVQFSLFGLLGATVGLKDGIEIQLLGLSFGVDFLRPAIKLPLIGRIGTAYFEPA